MAVSDIAFENAERQKNLLLERLAEIEKEIVRIREELEKTEKFLAEWEMYAAVQWHPKPDESGSRVVFVSHSHSSETKHKNPPREEVGNVVESMLDEFHQPLTRVRILSELDQRNMPINGVDPAMVLSTMMWRMKNRFRRIPGKGYWYADRPYPPDETVKENASHGPSNDDNQ